MRIDPALISSDTSNPCSRFPCRATLRIDSVLGYGSGFDRPLAAGDSVSATFAFTLGPTADLIPAMKDSLPGLTTGSAFTADLEGGAPAPGMSQPDRPFLIYGYQKLSTDSDHK